LEIHDKKWCAKCNEITDQTCFHMAYRKSEKSDDADEKRERWNCNKCHTDKTIVKEMPIPTEKGMLVKLLMSLGQRYELAGTTISAGFHEVLVTFRFPEHDMSKLREIADNWAERGYINAKQLLMLQRAGTGDVAKIPPRWAPSKREQQREAPRKVFDD
jgi:hypothetical protein